MNLGEKLDSINNVQIDEAFVNKVESVYQTELSDEVKRVLSLSKEAVPYEDQMMLRGLSNSEILNASKNLQVDFIEHSVLPVFYTGDNDYAAYDFSEGQWCLFNIVDELKFSEGSSLADVLDI